MIRDLLRSGATGADLAVALQAGLLLDAAQLPLWQDERQAVGSPTCAAAAVDELRVAEQAGTADLLPACAQCAMVCRPS